MIVPAFDDAPTSCDQAASAEIAPSHAFDEDLSVRIVIGMAMRDEHPIGACRVDSQTIQVDHCTWTWVEVNIRTRFDVDPAGMPHLINGGKPATASS
jgi:RNA 3'-terminal phosphate cyclase